MLDRWNVSPTSLGSEEIGLLFRVSTILTDTGEEKRYRKKIMDSEADAQTSSDSRYLYGLCCDVGFSPEQWQRRLQVSDVRNTCSSYRGLLPGNMRFRSLHSGSSSEGVGMKYLGSDIDVMYVFLGTSVIEGTNVSTNETDHMYQMVPTDRPAFVNLQLLSPGNHAENGVIPTPEYCEPDTKGRMFLNGDQLKKSRFISGSHIVHGPALTDGDIDLVCSLHCRTWPSVSQEWVQRNRSFNWPSQQLIRRVVKSGCELVPIKAPNSPTPHLDWRLSSPLAEKLLIRTFNIVQIQCYFPLKLILACRIRTILPGTLCSYHVKAVMLYVVEQTDSAIWTENNLTNCFMVCLRQLLSYLQSGYCPQYFITQQNLFEIKVQREARRVLTAMVTSFVLEGWKCVLRSPPFNNVGFRCLHPEQQCTRYKACWEKQRNSDVIHDVKAALKYTCTIVCDILNVYSSQSAIPCVEGLRNLNDYRVETVSQYFPCQNVIQTLRNQLNCTIVLSLLNETFSHQAQHHTIRVNIESARNFMTNVCEKATFPYKLKYAAFLYGIGEMARCVRVVKEALILYRTGLLPYCTDTSRSDTITLNTNHHSRLMEVIHKYGDAHLAAAHLVLPVVLTKWELPFCSPAIQRVVEIRELVTLRDQSYSSLLFVDPLIFAHQLLFFAYRDLGMAQERYQSLDMLLDLVQNSVQHFIFYPDIARLVYEYCLHYIHLDRSTT